MSGLKDYAGFDDSGGADQEYKLPTPGYHTIETTEGIKIFEAGEYSKINIPFVCSEGDKDAGMKFSIQIFLEGDYDPESDAKKIARILFATQTDDKFLAGFAKEDRVKSLGVLITRENFKKILSTEIAPHTVNALNILLPGIQFGVKLAVSKGDFPKVSFNKITVKGSPAWKEMFDKGDASATPVTGVARNAVGETVAIGSADEGWGSK